MATQTVPTDKTPAPFVHQEIRLYRQLEQRLRAKGHATLAEADFTLDRIKKLEERLNDPQRSGPGYYSPEGRAKVVAGRIRRAIAQCNSKVVDMSSELEHLHDHGGSPDRMKRLRHLISVNQSKIKKYMGTLKEMGAELPEVPNVQPVLKDDVHNTRRRQMKVVPGSNKKKNRSQQKAA